MRGRQIRIMRFEPVLWPDVLGNLLQGFCLPSRKCGGEETRAREPNLEKQATTLNITAGGFEANALASGCFDAKALASIANALAKAFVDTRGTFRVVACFSRFERVGEGTQGSIRHQQES